MYQPPSLRRLLSALLYLLPAAINGQFFDYPPPYGIDSAPDVTSFEVGWDAPYPRYEANLNLTHPTTIVNSTGNSTETIQIRAAQDFYLRIMPLGASITQGVGSSDGNGYRKLLRQQLRWKGWKVNMVGSKQDGNMADRDNEGHPGWTITQVHDAWKSERWKPNLVLINVGTNDCNQNLDIPNAGNRMKAMIDDIYSKVPTATVILSTLVKSRDRAACAADLSRQYRDLVSNTYRGRRIGLADIHEAISLSQHVSDDGIHPNDEGFRLFAAVWWDAISKLESQIQPPSSDIDDAKASTTTCPKVAGNARGPVQTQRGSGHDNGIYVHARVERGAIESARIQKGSDPHLITNSIPFLMYFANIIKNNPNAPREEALDDWIRVFISEAGETTYYFRRNLGGGTFGPSTTFDPGMNCPSGSSYFFADFDNDGLDDFYCIQDGGSVSVSINRGGSPPRFSFLGRVVPPSSVNIEDVLVCDIDGDGRADFCVRSRAEGTIRCSRNGGHGTNYFWQGFSTAGGLRGVVFDRVPAQGKIFCGDINGDFRADLLVIGSTGSVDTWINRRTRGKGIVPEWTSAGRTHAGMSTPQIQEQIKFGRIYGSGKLDYIYLKQEDDWFDVRVWENTGSGGTRRKADGTFYCDMRGTGSDDYVWIWSDGHSTEIYANTHNPPWWGNDVKINIPALGNRVGVHLADWTGNGRCDVLVQNRANGAITLYANNWDAATKTLTFTNRGVVATPGCTEGWGVGIFDRGMRIADLDGDGRADVICLERNGRITAWLNRASGMFNAGQVKFSQGWDRANLRFADVENSGRADIIWLDKYTGAARVWKNNGYAGPNGGGGGSSFSWTARGVLYSGIDRGEVMNFANLGGLGRADLIQVYPATNEAYTFWNECGSGGSGGDDGPIASPNLPDYSSGEDDDGHIILSTPVVSIIPRPTESGPPPEVTENATPIEADSYFWLDKSCDDRRTDDGVTYRDFVRTAVSDAEEIALTAHATWESPSLRGASDLYIGKNFHESQYAADFNANLNAAKNWGGSTWWFASYIRVNCFDTYNACQNKIGTDTRSIGGYANNTREGFFNTRYYTITLCPPFFTLNSLATVQRQSSDVPRDQLQLIFMENSGSKFLHEVMHIDAITENRGHIKDELFDTGRRIYGPKDVAKAARIAARDGFQYNYKNADTYAVFALAAYFEYDYGVAIPPEVKGAAAPAGLREYDYVHDHENNYARYKYEE